MKDIVSHFLILPLVSMTGLFDEDELVFICSWHMVIQIAEKLGGISIREIVICAYKKNTCVGDFFRLGEITVLSCVNIVKKSGKLPVIGSVGYALHPSHEGEGQHSVTVAALHLIFDDTLFSFCHA